MWCFVHFDLEMCFAPQRGALFRRRRPGVGRRPEPVCFLHFWLGNVLRAPMACTFSTAQLPKVARDRQVITLLTAKCASRHNGVHFLNISTSQSAPKLRCFRCFDLEMCFKSLEKNTVNGDVPNLFRTPASLSSFSSLIFSLLFFSSLALPTSAFPTIHIVGSLTSKLPSVRMSKHILCRRMSFFIFLCISSYFLIFFYVRCPPGRDPFFAENCSPAKSIRWLSAGMVQGHRNDLSFGVHLDACGCIWILPQGSWAHGSLESRHPSTSTRLGSYIWHIILFSF